jgi:peptide deformylase
MQVPIVKYGSSILRQHTNDVLPEDNPSEIAINLFETLYNQDGIGLAAPQIGILKRMFVIIAPVDNTEQEDTQLFEKAFINPTILWKSLEQIYYNEGCLSIPDIFEDVLRPKSIRVSYCDINLNSIEEQLDGIVARVFQHEYDHLDGILFIDLINPLKRKLLANKLNQIKKDR